MWRPSFRRQGKTVGRSTCAISSSRSCGEMQNLCCPPEGVFEQRLLLCQVCGPSTYSVMAISPQVFLCYGRPDREVAEAIVGSLWQHEIECYDYLAKPVEDRLGNESHHFRYI